MSNCARILPTPSNLFIPFTALAQVAVDISLSLPLFCLLPSTVSRISLASPHRLITCGDSNQQSCNHDVVPFFKLHSSHLHTFLCGGSSCQASVRRMAHTRFFQFILLHPCFPLFQMQKSSVTSHFVIPPMFHYIHCRSNSKGARSAIVT